MKPIAILTACLFCLASFAAMTPVTVYIANYPNASNYVIAWGATNWANPSQQITITPAGNTNIYAVLLLTDNTKSCYITQTTHFTNAPDAVGYTHLDPRTNLLSTLVWTATNPNGPWTNYNSFATLVDSNRCGFYRISTRFIK